MGLKNPILFDDLMPETEAPAVGLGSPRAGLSAPVSFDDLLTDPQPPAATTAPEPASAPKQGTFLDIPRRAFGGIMDRMVRPTIEGMKVFGAIAPQPELDAFDPEGSDGGRMLSMVDELRQNPASDVNRSAIQALGVNPDDLLSGDFNTASAARYKLSSNLRNIRLKNSEFVQGALQRGKEAQQRYAATAVNYGDDWTGTSMQFIEDVMSASVDMIPSIVASYAAGPAVGAMPITASVLGQSTLEGINEHNLTPDQTVMRAAYQTATEYFPTVLGLKVFKDGGGTKLAKIMKAAGVEGFEESLTEALQSGGDIAAGLEDMTVEEYLKRVGYSGAIGAGVGATLRTPIAMFEGDDPVQPVRPPQDSRPLPQQTGLRTVQPGESMPVEPQPLAGQSAMPEAPEPDPTFEQLMAEAPPASGLQNPVQFDDLEVSQDSTPASSLPVGAPVLQDRDKEKEQAEQAQNIAIIRKSIEGAANLADARTRVAAALGDEAAKGQDVNIRQLWNQKLQERRRKIGPDDSLAVAIAKMGGINPEWKEDITGDTKGNKMVPGVGPVFNARTGVSPDDIAMRLVGAGYFTQADIDNAKDNGGVNRLYELLRAELSGGRKTYQLSSDKAAQQVIEDEEDTRLQMYEAEREQHYSGIAIEFSQEAADLARMYDDEAKQYYDYLDAEVSRDHEDQINAYEQDPELQGSTEADAAAGFVGVWQADAETNPAEGEGEGRAAGQPGVAGESQEVEGFSLQLQTPEDLADKERRASDASIEAKAQIDREAQHFGLDMPEGNVAGVGQYSSSQQSSLSGFGFTTRGERKAIEAQQTPAETPIDTAANQAATSPKNDLPEPTDGQKEAGNYRKGHVRLHGLDISIENPKGSMRSGTDPDGKAWETELKHHYGYIRRTTGADGEQVDVFIGPQQNSEKVFIVDQVKRDGSFDEHKVMLGFSSKLAARKGYRDNYADGWTVGQITEMDLPTFKEWLKSGNNAVPAAPGVPIREIKVKRTFTVHETGKTATVTMPADEAIAELNKEIGQIKRLIRCLMG